MSSEIFFKKLHQFLDDNQVKTDSDILQNYGKDSTQLFKPNPLAVIFPKNADDVQAIVALANEYNVPLVPSGGRTGYSGGAVAASGEIVVSFEHMNKILHFDPIDNSVVCQPGVILKDLQDFAFSKGLFYPIDLASSGSCQIGGNIATNAGGIRVIRYGLTRNWVTSLKIITGKGDNLYLNKGLVKNASGYDLMQLFIGSEGTLGIITEATVKLIKAPTHLTAIILATSNIKDLLEILATFRNKIQLTAFEFFSEKALGMVLKRNNLTRPFNQTFDYYALIEFDNNSDEMTQLALNAFEECTKNNLVKDGIISQNLTQFKNFWRLREDISWSISSHCPYKYDISVTSSNIPSFIQEIDHTLKKEFPDLSAIWFGHIGDGNLHLNILKPSNLSTEEFNHYMEERNHLIFKIIEQFNGSISAEHGVGLLKKNYLGYTRSKEEISYMSNIKSIFDPNNIMNPGKIFL